MSVCDLVPQSVIYLPAMHQAAVPMHTHTPTHYLPMSRFDCVQKCITQGRHALRSVDMDERESRMMAELNCPPKTLMKGLFLRT